MWATICDPTQLFTLKMLMLMLIIILNKKTLNYKIKKKLQLFLKLKTCDSLHGCLGGIKINILISMLVIPFFSFNLEKKM